MIKLVGLFRIKSGLPYEDFVEYYENNHVPLILSLMPQICNYRRNYVRLDKMFTPAHVDVAPPKPPFDVLTEVWFPDQKAYDAMQLLASNPEIGGRIAADEANLFDRNHMSMFLVDERCSIIPTAI
jgi:hypothetical protein